MDLIQFQLMRKPRSTGRSPSQYARLEPIPSGATNRLDDSLLVRARKWQAEGTRASPQSPTDAAWAAVVQTDSFLISASDKPAGSAFANFRRALLAADPSLTGAGGSLAVLRVELSTLIILALANRLPKVELAVFCRWLLIVDLLDPTFLPDNELSAPSGADLVWARLRRRDVLVEAGQMPQLAAGTRVVKLVRDASVSDLFVVRSEWSCYHPAEVASITNILAGSKFEVEQKVTREQETTVTNDTQTTQSQEQEQQDRTQTELSREISRSSAIQANVNGSVNISGQYGLTHFGANASAGVSASLNENVQQASKISRDLVSKATLKVESQVREIRVQRLLTRTEDRTLHAINNNGQTHANGVYRWVDRVDRYQVFRFPNRLQLEFQLPEPAAYLLWRQKNTPVGPGEVGPPPKFDVKISAITPQNYADFALTFRASNLPAPPDNRISVTAVLKADYPGDPIDTKDKEIINVRALTAAETITLPVGYVAYSVEFEGIALPLRARWRVESILSTNDPLLGDQTFLEGFHTIYFSVMVGRQSLSFNRIGERQGVYGHTVQLPGNVNVRGWENRLQFLYGTALLNIPATNVPRPTIPLSPPVKDKLALGFNGAGASSAEITFKINLRVSESALNEWRGSVYDALLEAWRGWDQAYRTAALQKQALGGLGGWDTSPPARNVQIVRDEIKRQCITWMLGEEGFAGRDAMLDRSGPPNPTWDTTNLDEALKVAPEIQFFEQAFEWGNMTFVCYPYYWARGKEWPNLNRIESNDPVFAQFLRAGSVRVVVPARPGMEEAVKYYLAHGEPNLTGPLPIPGSDDYVSIAQEIHDLTAPISGGEPGPSWETRIATPLLWLDQTSTLPVNEHRRLGASPNAPIEPMCEGATPIPGTGGTPAGDGGFIACLKRLFARRG